MNFNEVYVKSGYELMAIVDCGGGYYHAVINRHSSCQPYVFCFCYDITDGTWGQGHYHDNYADAIKDFKEHI